MHENEYTVNIIGPFPYNSPVTFPKPNCYQQILYILLEILYVYANTHTYIALK